MLEKTGLLICVIIWFLVNGKHLINLLNLFQQHEYNNARFIRAAATTPAFFFRPHEFILLALLLPEALFMNVEGKKLLIAMIQLLFILAISRSYFLIDRQNKLFIKKLVFTARVYRLLIGSSLILSSELLVLNNITCNVSLKNAVYCPSIQLSSFLIGLILILQFTNLTIVLTNVIVFPLDLLIGNYYIVKARKKLTTINPFVIGITGSYGKTSTKHLVSEILKFEYSESDVLSTPKSYNTLMGVCKVINDSLGKQHKYFVVEMGAYKPGEIKKICHLVKPKIGILTAIGPQHLERFKTIENITKAKKELIDSLPNDGIAIFNGDDPLCRKVSDETKVRKLLYGTHVDNTLDIRATDISVSIQGTEFDITLKSQKTYKVKIQLLGRHNVSNSLAAILATLECSIPINHIIQSLVAVRPFEHRMQINQTSQGITVIDNAYNSNPLSAQISLEVIQAIQNSGNKILVTPGFAELGNKQDEEHFRLGQNAALACDFVFLVGNERRVQPILNGLLSRGFDKQRIFVNQTLTDARKTLSEIAGPGDIILFENDLPDIY